MKLLFIYVERERGLYGASLNFDGLERFSLSPIKGKMGEVEFGYEKNENNSLGDNFFSVDKRGREGVVESVSAIIGKNGSGKTSVAASLYNLGVEREEDGRKAYTVMVYKSRSKYHCVHNGHWGLSLRKLPLTVRKNWIDHKIEHLGGLPFSFVYYSPFSTTEDVVRTVAPCFFDVSTGNLLRESEDDAGRNDAPIFEHLAHKEYMRVIRFVANCHKEKISLPPGSELSLPVGVDIYVDIENLDRYRGDTERRDSKPRRFADGGCISFDDAFSLVNCQYLPFQLFGFLVHSLIDSLATFNVEPSHSVVGLCKTCSDVYRIVDGTRMSDDDCRRCFWLIEGVLSKCNFEGWVKLNKSALLDFHRILHKIFERRHLRRRTALRHEVLTSILSFSMKGADLDDLETLVLAHARIGYRHDLVKLKFEKMSSGEMAYLGMFGRFYDLLISGLPSAEQKEGRDLLIYLDEAETALHPDWQRQLVLMLIWFVEKFAARRRVHLVFASHSPVLLSDIPQGNVLYLHENEANPCCTETELPNLGGNTFGANIFDLYSKNFTFSKGMIGAFAMKKIEGALARLATGVKKRDVIGRYEPNKMDGIVLRQIGDELIRRYLESLREGGVL